MNLGIQTDKLPKASFLPPTTMVVPFFLNPDNMQYLLKGKIIENFEEMHNGIFTNLKDGKGVGYIKNMYPIYEVRDDSVHHDSEYPDINDRVIAKIVRYIVKEDGHNELEIEMLDSLACIKINNPCIKINGYFTETEDGNLHMTEVTRLTLASGMTL